jgi:hypothetical protein
VEAAVQAAKAAQPAWEAQPAFVRAAALRKLADLLRQKEHVDTLSEVRSMLVSILSSASPPMTQNGLLARIGLDGQVKNQKSSFFKR